MKRLISSVATHPSMPTFITRPLNFVRRLGVRDGNSGINLNDERAKALALSVAYIAESRVTGCVAEFGVCFGHSARATARAMRRFCRTRTLHLFDSFAGLPIPTETDWQSSEVKEGAWREGAMCGAPAHQIRADCLRYIRNVVVHPGLFAQTIPAQITPIAMAHVDCDYHSSSVTVLRWLLTPGVLSKGAIICFDDYLCSAGDPNAGQRRAWIELTTGGQVNYTELGCYAAAGWRCIVHESTKGEGG